MKNPQKWKNEKPNEMEKGTNEKTGKSQNSKISHQYISQGKPTDEKKQKTGKNEEMGKSDKF